MGISEREYVAEILKLLKKRYKTEMQTSLKFKNPWELLVSTVLSAQSTDASVNKITPAFFMEYNDVRNFSKVRPQELYKYTKSIGLYRSKSKNIVMAARMIVKDFDGKVPEEMDELVKLPGVGRKTANVILFNAFGRSEGVAIDTHCVTVANRLWLTDSKNPAVIEKELMGVVNRRDWGNITHLFIALGRDVCTARKKFCSECVLNRICPSSDWSSDDQRA